MKSHSEVESKNSQNSWRTRNVWAFSLASLFSDWGHEMVTALMPGFLIALGAPAIALGVTEGVSNFAQAMAAIWGGRVNDKHSHRHVLLILGYIMTGLKALMAWVNWWPWVVVLRSVAWTGRGARGPIRDAYIAEEVAPEQVGRAYGFREAFDTVGALLGPLGAALLVSSVSPRTLIAWTALPALLTIAVILRVRQLPPQPVKAPSDTVPGNVRWSRSFLQYRSATWLFTTGYVAPTFFILRVWQSHEALGTCSAPTLALLLYALHNGVYALSSFPVGWLSDRMRGRSLLTVGYSLWTVVVFGFFLDSHQVGWWILLFAMAGLATGIIEVAQKATTVRIVPRELRGRGLGQVAAVRGMGQFAAGLIMGLLWTFSNPQIGFGVETVFALLGSLAMIYATRQAS